MKVLTKICDILFHIMKWIVAVLMMIMVLLTFVEVIRRYFFGVNWLWSEVLVRYMIVWCTFLGGAAAFRAGQLVNFDLIVNKFNEKTKAVLAIIANILIFALAVWLTKLGVDSFLKPSIASQISVELGISLKWIYMGIPIGFFCMVVFAIEKIVGNIRTIAGKGAGSRAAKKDSGAESKETKEGAQA